MRPFMKLSGLSFVVMAIIGIILFFVMSSSSSCDSQDMSDKINDGFEIAMMLIMIIVAAWVSTFSRY